MSQFEESIERIKKATGCRTQVELAALLGIRQSSISDAKRRESVPADWLVKLYRSHGLNPEWVLVGEQPQVLREGRLPVQPVEGARLTSMSRPKSVYVSSMAGIVGAKGWMPHTIEQLAIPESMVRKSLQVVKADSTAMDPTIRSGAYVGVDLEQTRVMSGEVYAVAMPNEGMILRRIYQDNEAGRATLRCDNQRHIDTGLPMNLLEGAVLGRVVWVIQEI